MFPHISASYLIHEIMLQGACKAKNGTRKDLFMAVPLASNSTLQKTKDQHYSNKNLTGYCKIVLSMYFTIPFIMRRSLKMVALNFQTDYLCAHFVPSFYMTVQVAILGKNSMDYMNSSDNSSKI